MDSHLAQLSAVEAVEAIASGRLTSEELVRACLERIDQIDDTVKAWTHLDPEHALEQARAADLSRQEGKALGPLHGIPIGVKDIFDTKDMPTEDGTVLHAGRTPVEDATVVARMRTAGAIVMGKTVTTELALYAPGKTANPHDPERTPGGSSSGSAAAVAAHMVPLAIGTQTNGSVIRPASFCGVWGFKPSHGMISRHRILQLSRHLDQVGVFARTIEDAALFASELMAYDERDPDTRPRARPKLVETMLEEPPVTPRLAFVKTPVWDQASEDSHEAFHELVEHLGENAAEATLAPSFDEAHELHRTILDADLARCFEREYAEGKDKLSAKLREMIEHGQKCLAVDYNEAVSRVPLLTGLFDEIFQQYDAILTPATTGEAPLGLESTGSPTFCTIWTLCGMPAVSLPILQGANGLPIGAQLVAPKGDDARLLRTARWLAELVEG